MMKKPMFLAVVAAVLLVAGCASQKEPATQAIAAAERALDAVKQDAAKFVPNDLRSVESTIGSLKDSLAKGDYKAVLAEAPALMSSIGTLEDGIASKKAELEAAVAAAAQQWQGMATDLPKMVEAIQSRVDILSKSKTLPKSLDPASFESAKSGLEMMKSTWTEATNAFTTGNVQEAVSKAQQVKDKGAEVMRMLGLSAS